MPSPAAPHAPPGLLATELPPQTDPLSVFASLRRLPGCVFFDSSLRHSELGRYSYITADPFDWLTCVPGEDGFAKLAAVMDRFSGESVPGLPPFQGGAAGLFGYELSHALEELPSPPHNEFKPPAMAVGLYDVVIAFDHASDKSWLLSQGFPEVDPGNRTEHAARRSHQFLELLNGAASLGEQELPPPIDVPQLAPQFPLPGRPGVTSDFSREAYIEAVARAVEYIHSGDVFQVNLSQRLLAPLCEPAHEYYLRLRRQSPAPFSAYFDAGGLQLCSASPERFLRSIAGQVETRPIKGTRPRSSDAPRKTPAGLSSLPALRKTVPRTP